MIDSTGRNDSCNTTLILLGNSWKDEMSHHPEQVFMMCAVFDPKREKEREKQLSKPNI